MIEKTKVEELLTQLRPSLPEGIVDFEIETGFDSTGDEAIWIWVVLPDEENAPVWRFENREAIRNGIRDAVLEAGLPWAYVRFHEKSARREA